MAVLFASLWSRAEKLFFCLFRRKLGLKCCSARAKKTSGFFWGIAGLTYRLLHLLKVRGAPAGLGALRRKNREGFF